MNLQPLNSENEVFPVSDLGLKPSKYPSEVFCKTLTASDTSTQGGFSVPRRAAEKLFPPLDYNTIQPPTQELLVRDLHDNTWKFRHIYRGQPKRHLLTTGWSLFVSLKRLKAGDSVLFIRDEKSQLLVGVRRANSQLTTLQSSALSADSMYIGVFAAAAHAAANRSPFTIFYNPRGCPSDFVIPLAKYRKTVYGTQLSVGLRFGMMFETEESSKRRYIGTIVGISDLDPVRWPGSKWRNIQVEWDEPGCGGKQNRVSSWDIETTENLVFPSLASSLRRPLHNEPDQSNALNRHSPCKSDQLENLLSPLFSDFPAMEGCNTEKMATNPVNPQSHAGQLTFLNQNLSPSLVGIPQSDSAIVNRLLPQLDKDEWMVHSSCQPLAVQNMSTGSLSGMQEQPVVISQALNLPISSVSQDTRDPYDKSCLSSSNNWRDLSTDNSRTEIHDNVCVDVSSASATVVDPSTSSAILDEFCTLEERDFQTLSDCLVSDFSVSQDLQSQITSASLAESHAFSVQEFNSGAAVSNHVDFDERRLLQNNSRLQVAAQPPRKRTYTKVQKAGSVGRSIDVTTFKNYEELIRAIECMFGLEDLLNNRKGSRWKLVYVDYENDVLLVGDDPWKEFVDCVRCIRILSPTEVQQMSEEGTKLLNSGALQGNNGRV